MKTQSLKQLIFKHVLIYVLQGIICGKKEVLYFKDCSLGLFIIFTQMFLLIDSLHLVRGNTSILFAWQTRPYHDHAIRWRMHMRKVKQGNQVEFTCQTVNIIVKTARAIVGTIILPCLLSMVQILPISGEAVLNQSNLSLYFWISVYPSKHTQRKWRRQTDRQNSIYTLLYQFQLSG